MRDAPERPDRYRSYNGIDCMGDSRRLVAAISRHIDDPAKTDAFWEAFKVKLAQAASDGDHHAADELRLVCGAITYIEELFERYGDQEGLALLHQVEEACC